MWKGFSIQMGCDRVCSVSIVHLCQKQEPWRELCLAKCRCPINSWPTKTSQSPPFPAWLAPILWELLTALACPGTSHAKSPWEPPCVPLGCSQDSSVAASERSRRRRSRREETSFVIFVPWLFILIILQRSESLRHLRSETGRMIKEVFQVFPNTTWAQV